MRPPLAIDGSGPWTSDASRPPASRMDGSRETRAVSHPAAEDRTEVDWRGAREPCDRERDELNRRFRIAVLDAGGRAWRRERTFWLRNSNRFDLNQ